MIIIEILYFLIMFSIKRGSSPDTMLFFTTPLTATMLMLVVNVTLVAMSLNPRT